METKHLKLVYDINCNVSDQEKARAINVYDDNGNYIDAVSLPLWTDDLFRANSENDWENLLYNELKTNKIFRGKLLELHDILRVYLEEVRRSTEEAEKEIEEINKRMNG